MKKMRLFALGSLLLLPYVVSLDSDSSNVPNTFVEFALSKGLYADVTRDCNGNVVKVDKRGFWDAGGKITHEISVLKITAGAGVTNGDRDNVDRDDSYYPAIVVQHATPYLNGTVGLDTKYFGLDAGGALLFERTGTKTMPVGNIRIGTENLLYLSCGLGQNTCLFGGNSIVDVGLGFSLGAPRSLLWLGVGEFPYDGTVFSAKLDLPISDRIVIQPRGGLGLGQFGEYSIGIGAKMAF
jgi:hypothetical protein